MSAGSQPAGYVHPRSLALLEREGISTEGLFSKSWSNLPATPDIVITVCGNAAGETCPTYLSPALRVHWGVDDPAKATGSEAEINAAFLKAYQALREGIEIFLSLPLDDLQKDASAFREKLEQIALSKFKRHQS